MRGITFSIAPGTRKGIPRRLYTDIQQKILGSAYTLSVAVVDGRRMRALNRTHRGKDSATDILAFPLGKTYGEIILHLPSVHRKAKLFSMDPEAYAAYVFIHGCLHLQGYAHGRNMEKKEKQWCRVFDVPFPHE